MLNKIENYNASYPAAFYEIGTLYAFYAHNDLSGDPAPDDYVSRFSSALRSLESQHSSNAIRPVNGDDSSGTSGRGGLIRFYAVVVSKSAEYIEVMFLNNDNGIKSYLTKKYGVGHSCGTDGKDWMAASIQTNVPCGKGVIQNIGGITRIRSDIGMERVGGITRTNRTFDESANIGGITRMKSKSTNSSIKSDLLAPNNSTPKVGGITRMKKR